MLEITAMFRIHKFLGLPDPDPSINKQKNLEKPLFRQFCDFLMTFKTDVSVSTVSNKQKKLREKKLIFVGVLKGNAEKSRMRNPVYGSKDPDPYKNVTAPEHWTILVSFAYWCNWICSTKYIGAAKHMTSILYISAGCLAAK
jgi:hypothetical protein